MKPNVIQEKSFDFGVRIVRFCDVLKRQYREYDLASQLLRSGTSIGANVEEALSGQSRKDFVHKLAIAAKEARETNYWIRPLIASEIANEPQLQELKSQSQELIRILNSIILTSQSNMTKEAEVDYCNNSEFRIQNSELVVE